jgi:hypothetical protein
VRHPRDRRCRPGAVASGEVTLAPQVFGVLAPGVLLLADRGFTGFELWRQATATGAVLVWRTKTNAVLPVTQALADGSYLSQVVAAGDHRHRRDPIAVRVVEYALGKDRGRPASPAPYRLLTTILDPDAAPAAELAALCQQRWEFGTALDELKTHQRGPGVVLRSRSPEMVAQELWGMLLVHHAIRRLVHQAALAIDVDPDRLSFTRSLRIVRRQVTTTGQAAFPRGVPEVGMSCCVLVLVDQPTKDVAATQPAQVRRTPCFGAPRRHRRRMGQAAVRAALVVMLDIGPQDADKLLAADDQQLVEALPTHGTDPPFGDSVGVGRLHRCADIPVPVERHTSSNARVNLASRSRIRNFHAAT